MLLLLIKSLLVPADIEVVAVETVTIPADIGVTSKPFPKLIVPAVPTVEPLSFTITPEPDAVIPVNPEPSPMNDDAVTIPANCAAPAGVIVAADPTNKLSVIDVIPMTVTPTPVVANLKVGVVP